MKTKIIFGVWCFEINMHAYKALYICIRRTVFLFLCELYVVFFATSVRTRGFNVNTNNVNVIVLYYSIYPQIGGAYSTKCYFQPIILGVNLLLLISHFPVRILNDLRHPIR